MSTYRPAVVALAAAVALVLTASAPVAAAQDADAADEQTRPTSQIRFYGHVFGHGLDNPMPANTQFPTGEDNYGLGSYDACAGPVSCDEDPNNKLVFYSTAGFVQVSSGDEFRGGGGYSQLHNERGSTKDIVLDTRASVAASVYVSHDLHGWAVNTAGETYCIGGVNPRDTPCLYPYWGWDPGVSPAFVVKASLYYAVLGEYGSAASDMPPIRDALEGGEATLVAEGETAPQQVVNGLPGYQNVYRFDVDLGAPKIGILPKEANFFLVYSIYNVAPDGTKYQPHTWRWWSGEFFPPSFSLPVKNAFDVEGVIPQFVHGKLAILGVINTPWGSYDVDPKATRLTITKVGGGEVTPVRIEALADYSVAHGAHYKPVNVTFVWDYPGDNLAPGEYEATISAANHQQSAAASCSAYFTVLDGGRPGPVEVGLCGLQTDERVANKEGDPNAPPASGGDSTGLALPFVGVAGIVLAARRRWL